MTSDTLSRIKRALLPRLRLQQAYKNLFACNPPNPDAQRILNNLIKTCHVTTPAFVAGDPYLSAYNEGKRAVVISMLHQIHLDHEQMRKQLEQTHENSENG